MSKPEPRAHICGLCRAKLLPGAIHSHKLKGSTKTLLTRGGLGLALALLAAGCADIKQPPAGLQEITLVTQTPFWGLYKLCDGENLIYITDGNGKGIAVLPGGCAKTLALSGTGELAPGDTVFRIQDNYASTTQTLEETVNAKAARD